jgi:outer membrane receptor protein involved in Fe transport
VVVTAQRTEEDVQDVPISIRVLTKEEIEDADIITLEDIAQSTPNFSVFNATGNRYFSYYSIRGLSFELNGMVSYGTYNDLNLRASVGGPLVEDRLFYRLAGSYGSADGYFSNIFLDDRLDERSLSTCDWDTNLRITAFICLATIFSIASILLLPLGFLAQQRVNMARLQLMAFNLERNFRVEGATRAGDITAFGLFVFNSCGNFVRVNEYR